MKYKIVLENIKNWSPAVLMWFLIPKAVKFKRECVCLYLELKEAHSFTFNERMKINVL